jgi:hypothetical protein
MAFSKDALEPIDGLIRIAHHKNIRLLSQNEANKLSLGSGPSWYLILINPKILQPF